MLPNIEFEGENCRKGVLKTFQYGTNAVND